MRVEPRPMLKLEWSEMAPMICGENVSPKQWMLKKLRPMAVARTGAETELTMAALSGPVLRKRKNSATKQGRNGPGWRTERRAESRRAK